ncbi:hypothetical protein BD770DRAFT_469298 [Pilaira anomala]|nr:hypothetical protein BD770DRAFT_469298 [Pilaira anomala]
MKISLTGLPDQYGRLFGGTEQLTRDMTTNMSRFGTLLDCGFVTGASGVYSGNGYATYTPIDYSKETGNYSDSSTAVNVLATWAQMPPYCRYYHAPDHSMNHCQLRLKNMRCNLCHETGHIRKDCGRRNVPSTDHAKKRKTTQAPAVTNTSAQPPRIDLTAGSPEPVDPSVTPATTPTTGQPDQATPDTTNDDVFSSTNDEGIHTLPADTSVNSSTATVNTTATSTTSNSSRPHSLRLRSRYESIGHSSEAITDMGDIIQQADVATAMDHNTHDEVPVKQNEVFCKSCGLSGHQRTNSNKCPNNPKFLIPHQQSELGESMELYWWTLNKLANLLETEIPGSNIPFAKQLSSIGWASSCLFFSAETIAPYLNEAPLNPFHCFIEQEASLISFAQCNDPTLIRLYTKMKSILGDHIHDNESSIHLLKTVNILNNVIAYVDEIAQKRHLDDSLSDFEFAEQQADKNGYRQWKAQFQQWKILDRFEHAYHRSMKKQKQSKQTEHQQDTPVVASSPLSLSSSSSSPSGTRQPSF